jgi:hypothetical protein
MPLKPQVKQTKTPHDGADISRAAAGFAFFICLKAEWLF